MQFTCFSQNFGLHHTCIAASTCMVLMCILWMVSNFSSINIDGSYQDEDTSKHIHFQDICYSLCNIQSSSTNIKLVSPLSISPFPSLVTSIDYSGLLGGLLRPWFFPFWVFHVNPVSFLFLIYFRQVTIIIEWVIIVSVESSCLSFLSAYKLV